MKRYSVAPSLKCQLSRPTLWVNKWTTWTYILPSQPHTFTISAITYIRPLIVTKELSQWPLQSLLLISLRGNGKRTMTHISCPTEYHSTCCLDYIFHMCMELHNNRPKWTAVEFIKSHNEIHLNSGFPMGTHISVFHSWNRGMLSKT